MYVYNKLLRGNLYSVIRGGWSPILKKSNGSLEYVHAYTLVQTLVLLHADFFTIIMGPGPHCN